MIPLCFATHNPHKIKEAQAILGQDIDILLLASVGCYEALPETEDTIEANALQKATYVHTTYHVDCFTEDTGLCVIALKGAPGVRSARYAGEKKQDADNSALLLKHMQGVKDRRAYFKSVIALALKGTYHFFEGRSEGLILDMPRGQHGFGYDPIFVPEGETLSFAEMPPEKKNHMSHRRKALEKLVYFLSVRRPK